MDNCICDDKHDMAMVTAVTAHMVDGGRVGATTHVLAGWRVFTSESTYRSRLSSPSILTSYI